MESITEDITDIASLKEMLRGVDHVYNCAELLEKWGLTEGQRAVVNVGGVQNQLTVCRPSSEQHIIQLSAGAVTAPAPREPIDETYSSRGLAWTMT